MRKRIPSMLRVSILVLTVSAALSERTLTAQWEPFSTGGGPNGKQALDSVRNHPSKHFRWKPGTPIPHFFDDAHLFANTDWKGKYQQVVEYRATNSNCLSIHEQAQPGDVVRLSASGLPDIIMVYLGERGFFDDTEFNQRYSFFAYAWYNGLEVNTFPPRNHERLFRYAEEQTDSKPKRKLINTSPQTLVEAPHQRGVWTWIRQPTGKVTKSLFIHSRHWKLSPYVTVYRRKDAPRKYFIRRPTDMMSAPQVNSMVCFIACLASLDRYHGEKKGSQIVRQLEILYKYFISNTNFDDDMLKDVLKKSISNNPNPLPEWADKKQYRKKLASDFGWVFGPSSGTAPARYLPFQYWSTIPAVQSEILEKKFNLKQGITPEETKAFRSTFIDHIKKDRPVILLITSPGDYRPLRVDTLPRVKECALVDDFELVEGNWNFDSGHWVVVLGLVISHDGSECLYYLQDPLRGDSEKDARSGNHIYKIRENTLVTLVNKRRAPTGQDWQWPNMWYHE